MCQLCSKQRHHNYSWTAIDYYSHLFSDAFWQTYFFFLKLNQIINNSDLVSANNKPSIVRIFQVKLRRRTTKMIELSTSDTHTTAYNLLPPHKTIFTIKHACICAPFSAIFFFKLVATLYAGMKQWWDGAAAAAAAQRRTTTTTTRRRESVCFVCAACVCGGTAQQYINRGTRMHTFDIYLPNKYGKYLYICMCGWWTNTLAICMLKKICKNNTNYRDVVILKRFAKYFYVKNNYIMKNEQVN